MSELDDAIARLERAVERLEAAPAPPRPAVDRQAVREIANRVDAALARLEQLLEGEG